MPKKKLPKVVEEFCIGCGHCVMACPLGVLKVVNKKAKVVNPAACDSEGRCIAACPQKAIPHLQEQEYA
ncbi:MAG: 4Fe-4S binding protein [Candidatus Omnitrophota bacterium]